MFNEFVVKVIRYWGDESGSQGWDGWFYSKVYAIEGNEFLVYDNGSMSAFNTEEDYCEEGFVWVDFTEAIPKCLDKGYEMRVQPCVADAPQTEDYDFRDEQEYNDRWQTDCGWGEPITVSHNEDKED